MFTPSQVAKRANAHPNSIRNWGARYAELLSPAASGEDGARLYSDQDMEILCTIAALRRAGVPPGEVVERIRNEQVPPIVDVVPTALQEQPTEALQQAIEPHVALQVVYMGLQSRVEALERRVEVGANQLVTGIVIGVAITLVVVAIALSMVQ